MAKILFTSPNPFIPQMGGVEAVTDILCRELMRRGHKCYYYHSRSLRLYDSYDSPAEVYFSPSDEENSADNVKHYANILKHLEIDIIINQWALFCDSKLYNSVYQELKHPMVVSVIHNNPILNYDTLWHEISRVKEPSLIGVLKCIARMILYSRIRRLFWQERKKHFHWVINHSHHVVLLSSAYIASLQRLGLHTDKISVIPNPCAYEPTAAHLKCKKKHIVYVGRLERNAKQPMRLVRIWKRLASKFPDWKLIFCGDGTYKRDLEHHCRDVRNVSFAGRVNPENYYKEASILCLVSDFEGFPMVLPEAMAYGVVPIAYNSFPAYSDIVENEIEGVHITPFDETEYIEKLEKLICDEPYRSRLARFAIEKAKRFSLPLIAAEWEKLLKESEACEV